ncbi:hypothetical protein [Novosphingobium sp. CF614]|uniref:hypothetical protein n=1 Tax=Novosphingobium sp. CF614 TaxID=1884364 RepID=UPI002100AAC8|nr:hypothetical protein [Novosphingobium sp. CF614]
MVSRIACSLAAITATMPADAPVQQRQASSTAAPMRLGAASNFSQGWSERTWRAALDLPLRRLRDGIRWADVERTPGQYQFDKPTTTWPDRFPDGGAGITLTLNWGNPLYDDGETPHSPQALAAFGRFAAAVTRRFPHIDTLEIGNEINGSNFVSGPVKDAGLAERGRYHLAMVRAAAAAVRKVRPDVRVIGGSTHSLPAGFLWPLLDMPGAGAIEGLAVHPYTTPIDQLPAQIGLLRRHGPAAALPLHVTEFGSEDTRRAADDLMRGYATLAALGAAEMDWYPFNERGDGLVPLVGRDGMLTDAGKAFRFIQSRLAGLAARDTSPDRFTSVRAFGLDTQVLWGAPRAVTIDAAKVTAFDAAGARLDPRGLSLREDRALVLIGREPLAAGQSIRLGCNPLIADSFHQFGYPQPGPLPGPLPGGSQAPGDGFARFVRVAGREMPFEVMPGQQRAGVPWTPYLGRAGMANLRLMADTMLPAIGGKDGAIIHRYLAGRDARVRLVAEFTVSQDSADGITVALARDEREILARAGSAPVRIDLHLTLRKGQTLTLSVGPGANARGDTTRYRIQVFDEGRCPKDASPES